MAAKIGILDIHQAASDRPPTYVKRSTADLLVRRLLARRIHKYLIQLVMVKAALKACEVQAIRKAPIEGKMPPLEVPGVHFQEPQSDQWKLQHRTVRFV